MSVTDRKLAERAIADFLRAIGHDPTTEQELLHTPARVTDAFLSHLDVGRTADPAALVASHAIEGISGEVVVRAIPVLTTCPHHLMLATGNASVGFLARGRGVGLGAIADVLRVCSRRLILQEAIGELVCDAIATALDPAWVFCRLTLAHGCMRATNDSLHHTTVETLALRGDVPRDLVAPRDAGAPAPVSGT